MSATTRLLTRATAGRVVGPALGVLLVLGPVLTSAASGATVVAAVAARAPGTLQACSEVRSDSPPTRPEAVDSDPMTAMQVKDATDYELDRGRVAGDGVVVAVIDSGIADIDGVTVAGRRSVTDRNGPPDDGHGTVVAGLIAGHSRDHKLIGIAPRAKLVDIRAYDAEEPEDGSDQVGLDTAHLADALQEVLDLRAAGTRIDIVNVSAAVDRNDELGPLVEELWRAGVVVVAPSGDRDLPYLTEDVGDYQGSEDVADRVFPAGYDHVVAVATTAEGAAATDETDPTSPSPTSEESALPALPDPATVVFANSRTVLAAPSLGAMSYGLNGDVCRVDTASSDWATAEISGLLAMLKTGHRKDTAAQLVGRLVQTAAGLAGDPTPFIGYGVVQPYDALTQPLQLGRDGRPQRPPSKPVVRESAVADPPPDPLAGTRGDLVWWALAGGGALALTLMLAPVLSRRRTQVRQDGRRTIGGG